jgi:transposase-like protein
MARVGRDRHSTRMRRRYTKEQRSQLVELVTGSDVAVPEAAARLGVGASAAYNWVAESRTLRKSKPARPATGPTFVRLVPSAAADTAIAVRVGGAEIQVRPGFDGELLREVVATLAEGIR